MDPPGVGDEASDIVDGVFAQPTRIGAEISSTRAICEQRFTIVPPLFEPREWATTRSRATPGHAACTSDAAPRRARYGAMSDDRGYRWCSESLRRRPRSSGIARNVSI